MRVLGIDPGIAIVGYGVIDYTNNHFKTIEYGAITTPSDMTLPNRLKIIYNELQILIERCQPQGVSIEELFFNVNTKTALTVGHGRGVCILAAANSEIPVFEYTPLQVKQAVTGYGRADKNQVQQMVKAILNLQAIPKPDDTADALAIAICHAHSFKYNNSMQIKR